MGGGNGWHRALYSPPPNGQIAPQRADPTVEGARGAGPDRPPSCQMGRGRASPCWALSRVVPVLVSRAEIAAQARPGLWHGHGTGLRGNRPGRVSAVLYRTGPVPARWARPIWPTIVLRGPIRRRASSGPMPANSSTRDAENLSIFLKFFFQLNSYCLRFVQRAIFVESTQP